MPQKKYRIRASLEEINGTSITKAWITDTPEENLKKLKAVLELGFDLRTDDIIEGDTFTVVVSDDGEHCDEGMTEQEVRDRMKEDHGTRNITYPNVLKGMNEFFESSLDSMVLNDEPSIEIFREANHIRLYGATTPHSRAELRS